MTGFRSRVFLAKGLARLGAKAEIVRRLVYAGHRWPGGRFGVVISFDLDTLRDEAQLPTVLDVLAREGVHASFACIGRRVEAEPALYRRIVEGGHEVINHSYAHGRDGAGGERRWSDFSDEERMADIRRAHEVYRRVLGVTCLGFRTPHFDFVPADREVMVSLGYLYDSSGVDAETNFSGSLPFPAGGVLEIPVWRKASTSLVLQQEKGGREVWLARVAAAMDVEIRAGGVLTLFFDPMDLAPDGSDLAGIIRRAREAGAEFCTLKGLSEYLEGKI
ncbi:MAG: polysaccharide deacetylase family protein [Planctomycetota bacterium]